MRLAAMSSIALVIFLVDCTDLMRRRRTRSAPPATSSRLRCLSVALALEHRVGGDHSGDGGLDDGAGAVGGRELVGEALEGGLEGVEVGDVAGRLDAVEH